MAERPDLLELCRAAVGAARDGEAVEAYAEESRRTEAEVRDGEVEGLTSAASRGVGVRVVVEGRLGYAFAADPTAEEVLATVARARENAALATPDEHNVLPDPSPWAPLPELYRAGQAAMPTERKVALALELERAALATDPRVRRVERAQVGDAVSRVAIASTTGVEAAYERTDCWCAAVALAEQGDETQTGFSFRIGRELDELGWEEVARESAARAARMLGAAKPPTARLPVVLDPFAGSSFLGVLAGALSAEAVLKGRSLLAGLVGERVASEAFELVDDGRLLAGPAAAPFDDEGVPTARTELVAGGVLRGFLHNAYTAHRAGTASTGNARRAGYRSTPGVGTTNLHLLPGPERPERLLARAEGGVLIQDVSGVHSGANPVSGEFSVGATGLRIGPGGELAEPLREMTVASTLPEMLRAVVAVADDLRFFASVGIPTVLVGEMTVGGR
ncbi:MAG TPA: TldD/PmbA family protein [Actinomycetota bacterium]|nr:TldD/PmbA family protein [Actinomycetota bacterium]